MAKPAAVNHTDDESSPERCGAACAPLDLVHLSRQSLGDQALERELLTLFRRQAGQFRARLIEPRRPGDVASRADLAHTLKGSARAVGAFPAADAAEDYENALRHGAPDADRLCGALVAEIDAARAAIAALFDAV